MTVEILSSLTITNLDGQPTVKSTAGEGAPGICVKGQDYVVHTVAFGSATGNASRQNRFPTEAKIKHVWIFTSGLDSNAAATLKLDMNVAFSDQSLNPDVTPVSLQAQIPQSTLSGLVTSLASYTAANKMFGSAYAVANSGAVKFTDITYNNTFTPAFSVIPMWGVLGGTGIATAVPLAAGGGFAQASGSGLICSPGGWLDLLMVTNATAATAAVGTIGTEIDYVL
jgi:hypothetical protein